jgi:hypothetical protein
MFDLTGKVALVTGASEVIAGEVDTGSPSAITTNKKAGRAHV